jgi:hypothetical protein
MYSTCVYANLLNGPTIYRKLGNANIVRTYIDTRYRMFHPITKTDHNKNGLLMIFKKKGGYILKIITKIYVSCNDDITSFCYKSLITILVVMMMRRRRWTVMMIWNILRMLLTILNGPTTYR